jgi:N-methylhydantoinase A
LAPIRHDFSQGLYQELQPETLDDVRAVFERQEAEAKAVFAEEGHGDEERVFRYSLDISYQHQLYHINVPIRKYGSVEEIIASFDELYRRHYSNPLAGGTPIVVNARLTSESEPTGLTFDEVTGRSETGRSVEPEGERMVFFDKGAPCETPIYGGRSRAPGELRGPAIIEEPDTTISVPPGWRARTERAGILIMTAE